jgi:hypothetical protein
MSRTVLPTLAVFIPALRRSRSAPEDAFSGTFGEISIVDLQSDQVSTYEERGPCTNLIQFPVEILILPAMIVLAALSLSPHAFYSQTSHVGGCLHGTTTMEADLNARTKLSDAIGV